VFVTYNFITVIKTKGDKISMFITGLTLRSRRRRRHYRHHHHHHHRHHEKLSDEEFEVV